MNLSIKISRWWQEDARLSYMSEGELRALRSFVEQRQGWVYVVRCTTHPEWGHKIGRTQRNPFLRAQELQSAGSPHTFKLVSAVKVMNAPWAEKTAHDRLRHRHLFKEWFQIEADEAKNLIVDVQDLESGRLGRYFNLELLQSGDPQTFVEHGFYVDELARQSL